jgi:ATP-binding cassette subfamily E protein 1
MFVVEHDMMVAVSLGSEVNSTIVVISSSCAMAPIKFSIGINDFLKTLGITFRTETMNARVKRPRINKLDSIKDREQKQKGEYYK